MKTLKQYCNNQILEDTLLKQQNFNIYQGPCLKKIVISIGVKESNLNTNKILTPLILLLLITGQQPTITKARRSIASYKLREGKVIGCKITLRGNQMYTFLEKFIHIILPQLSDMKLSNYKNRQKTNQMSIGIKDSNIFPELENQYELISTIQGMNIDFYNKELILKKKKLFFSALKFNFS